MKQQTIRIASAGYLKTRLDLIKGFNTKALIYKTIICTDPFLNYASDLKGIIGLSIQDYEISDTPTSIATLLDDELIFTYMPYLGEHAADGMYGVVPMNVDHFLPPIEIVVPMTIRSYCSTGLVMYCTIFYDVVSASKDEIIKIASLQGLQMEV